MVFPWQRHPLADAGVVWQERKEEEAVVTLTPESVLLAVAVLALLVLLVLQCACRDNSSSSQGKEKKASSKRHGTTQNTAMAADSSVEVEATPNTLSPGETSPVINGMVHSGRNGVSPSGHNRTASSGSAQIRPTSLRELPDLPVSSSHKRNLSGQGGGDILSAARCSSGVSEKDEDGSGYDHLGAKIPESHSVAVNYDHIHLESPRDLSSGTTPQSEVDMASEGHYTQVRERTYDVVRDVRARANVKVSTSSDYDTYAKVKDEEEDDREDRYAKVRDMDDKDAMDSRDGNYSSLKRDYVLTMSPGHNTASDGTSATADDEDPYEQVIGDSGGAELLVSTEGGPDDPYTLVSDQIPASFGGGGASPLKSMGKHFSPPSVEGTLGGAGMRLQYADEEETDGQNDYATVVKDRSSTPATHRGGGGVGEQGAMGGVEEGNEEAEEIDPYSTTTPPEPPRLYGESEVCRMFHVSGNQHEPARSHNAREHRYSKVTARESLASMSARNALNTYEVVPDLPENTYATVDGGSGDGVVRYATPGNPSLHLSLSEMSETYAEIGASGSGGYAVAPEPPSLDSLHSMTKSTTSNDGDHPSSTTTPARALPAPTSPCGANNVIVADDGYAVVSKSGFSPSETALPQIPGPSTGVASPLGGSGEERVIAGITLHADYHSVKDCVVHDGDNENDPNYESVDEALSRSPANSAAVASVVMAASSATTSVTPRVTVITNTKSPARVRHQYEEVSPPSSPLSSPNVSVSNRTAVGAAASNGLSTNGATSNGDASKKDNSENTEAAEVRDRVLQGHMYEDICEVKNRHSSAGKTHNGKKPKDGHSVRL